MPPTAKVWLGRAFTALCFLITAASAYNVFGDNVEVEILAKKKAGCASEGCTITKIDRNPIGQSYEIVQRGGKAVQVHCARAAWLVGSWACEGG